MVASRGDATVKEGVEIGVLEVESALGLHVPEQARSPLERPAPPVLAGLVCGAQEAAEPDSLWATTALRMGSEQPVPPDLLAVGFPDDRTVACLVCGRSAAAGTVVRWHLDAVPPGAQGRLLDTSLGDFLDTYATEERHRLDGLERMSRVAAEYARNHGETGKAARAHQTRTIRLASQNVIVGLAALRHDLRFDGLAVSLWQTTQAPHVVTHEGNRALLAMTLAAAYQFGGTMEIRFDAHPQRAVPACLRQFARVHGVPCGEEDSRAITPAEARELFRACAPCGEQLERLLNREAAAGQVSFERARWLVLSGIWSQLELTFMLASAPALARSVLTGGCPVLDRSRRQAEMALCRAAAMLQTLCARLSLPDAGDDGHATVIEDVSGAVDVTVLGDEGAAVFSGVTCVPWADGDPIARGGRLVVVPRAAPELADAQLAGALAAAHEATAAVLAPKGAPRGDMPPGVVALECPDHLHDLDAGVENRLLAAAVARR